MKTIVMMAVVLMAAMAAGYSNENRAAEARAYFAGGCFWCVEHDMKKVPGVKEVVSGYAGGHVLNPTYEEVTSGTTGHREAVMVVYDPGVVSYREIIDRFWRLIDPFDAGGQFCDRGFQYTVAVFVQDEQEKAQAEASRAGAEEALGKGAFAVQILPYLNFFPAEDYHQDFSKENPIWYRQYRNACGRDRRVDSLWKRE